MTSYSKFLAALDARYDHQSARVVLAEALEKAGVSDKKNYDPKEAAAITRALVELGDGLDEVLSNLDDGGDKDEVPVSTAPAEAEAPGPASKAKAPAKKPPAKKPAAKKKK